MVIDQVSSRRLTICRGCTEWQGRCRLGHSLNGATSCPLGKFPGFLPLGDAVAAVAKPVARLSDALFGTTLLSCGRCPKRQARLNSLVKS